jgi:para-aminobenzoate synthetase component 2
MILIIDNYDSFVYNLARYVSELGFSVKVVRNDAITIADIISLAPTKIIISPGPCDPSSAGISLAVISYLGSTIPIFGVCLGHQAMGQVYGGKVIKANKPFHGKASMISHDQKGIFKNIANPLKVGRYHSLIVDRDSLPDNLMITAESEEGEIMALAHKLYPVYGVQFHPESIMTEHGYQLLNNFLTSVI